MVFVSAGEVATGGLVAGHATSDRWLAAAVDLAPELKELHDEHVRLRGRLAEQLAEMERIDAAFTNEDARFQDALRRAFRDGLAAPRDERTSPEVRRAQRSVAEERVWAAAEVLADHADKVTAAFREHEDAMLGRVRQQAIGAVEQRREAEELLAKARAKEWQAHRFAGWVLNEADGGPMAKQPAPTATPPPPQFQLRPDSLTRPWHRQPEEAAA